MAPPKDAPPSPGAVTRAAAAATEAQLQAAQDEIEHLQEELARANLREQRQSPRRMPPPVAGDLNDPRNAAPIATAVSFKLPQFYVDDPLMWFTQCESVFRRRLCTDPTQRFDAVVEALPPHIALAARDVILTVDPEQDPTAYQQLRNHITGTYGRTKWQLAAAVLDTPMLGDRKPTAVLTEMRANKPPNCQEDTIFQLLFIRSLPQPVGAQIMAADLANVDAMAQMADRIVALPRAAPTASSIEDPGLVAAVTARGRSPTRPAARGGRGGGGRGSAGNAGRGRGGRTATPGGGVAKKLSWCKYHLVYGKDAQKCDPSCTWRAEGN